MVTAHPLVSRTRAVVVAAGALAVAAAFLPDRGGEPVVLLLGLAQLLAAGVLVRAATRRDVDGDAVWRWWAVAVGLLTIGPAATLVAGVSAWWTGASVVLAAPFMYQALVRWNRFRTYVSDPGDWLNGVSAVCAFTAVGLVGQDWIGYLPAQWPAWKVQLWLVILASIVILLGTALAVAVIGGLLRDPRMWIVLAALTGLVAVSLTLNAPTPSFLHAQAGWTSACLAIAFASTLRGNPVPQPATTQAPAVGALVVLAVGVAVLVVEGPRDGSTATLYATLAVLGVSVRVAHLVRELGDLARSRRQAHTDELTGVGNRRALQRELDRWIARRSSGALLLLDLDGFKEVNDRAGHHAGDDLLRRVTAATADVLPSTAVLTRLGGDEFAVLVPDLDETTATDLARTVHASVVQGAGIGVSVGVRAVPAADLDPDRLLRQADTAMYTAKVAGGGVSVYDSEVDARLRDRGRLAHELRELLTLDDDRRTREVVVHYQPQLDVVTGRVSGVEALVRWNHRERGMLPPLTFLDLVEQQGLMDLLTLHVLRVAAADAHDWQHRGVPLRVSVNLSASCLTHAELLHRIDDVLAAADLAPGRLVLEVTETTLMADPDQALAITHELTRRGVQLSIDDYGTGYSSLAYLTDLPATELKLDRAFTARVVAEPRTAEIVGATVSLAHRLGLRVVAEGVEDEPTLAVLRGLDVDESQGYLHSRPLPPAAFGAWLAAYVDQVVGVVESREV